jgi:hypothetical protein
MATFELTGPDGGTYQLDAPDENAALSAFSSLHGQQTNTQQPNTVADVAKGAASGLATGLSGMAGLQGDLRNATLNAAGYVGGKLGASPEAIAKVTGLADKALRYAPFLGGDTSAEINQKIQAPVGGPYEPQTVPGQYAKTAAEFLPGALGGEGAVGSRLLKQVVAPAVTSESAGQLTKGTAAEPYARVAGALAGGAGAAKVAQGMAAAKAVQASTPTVEQLGNAAEAAYNHPVVKALELNPSSTAYQSGKIADSLNKSGFRDITAPQTYKLVDELKSTVGPTAKVADIQAVRSALGKVAGNFANPIEQAAANKAIRGIDDYLSNLQPYDVAAGNGAQAAQILNEAKGNYAAKMRATRLDNAEYRAELNAASAHSGGNINNATRQALKSLLLNPKAMRGFTEEEKAAIEQVVKGTATGNALRKVGKLLATSGMHGANVLAGSAALAPLTHGASLAAPVVGAVAKRLADRSTAKGIANLDSLIASRSPLAQQMRSQLPPAAPQIGVAQNGLLGALLASNPMLMDQLQGLPQPQR